MSKLVKELIRDELRTRYGALDSAVWVELLGVDGITTNDFRRNLHTRKMRLEVIKTSLFREACKGGPLGRLADHLQGPAALVTGGDSPVEIAKALEEWLPKIKGLKLRGALLEGEFIDEQAVVHLSKMPTKRDLQARVASVVRSPGANLAAAILSPGARVAGCVKTLIEKLEKAEPAEPAAA